MEKTEPGASKPSDRTRNCRHKFKLSVWRTFFTTRTLKDWNRLSTNVKQSLFMEVFKTRCQSPEQPVVVCRLYLEQEVGLDNLPVSLLTSVILCLQFKCLCQLSNIPCHLFCLPCSNAVAVHTSSMRSCCHPQHPYLQRLVMLAPNRIDSKGFSSITTNTIGSINDKCILALTQTLGHLVAIFRFSNLQIAGALQRATSKFMPSVCSLSVVFKSFYCPCNNMHRLKTHLMYFLI